jgi:hypothetical protein
MLALHQVTVQAVVAVGLFHQVLEVTAVLELKA